MQNQRNRRPGIRASFEKYVEDGALTIPPKEFSRRDFRACARVLAEMAADGTIKFPYNGVPDPDSCFANLLSSNAYVVLVKKVTGVQSGKIVWEFDGSPLSLVTNEEAYDDVDQLTNAFTEGARMQARTKGSLSPLEYWETPEQSEFLFLGALKNSCRKKQSLNTEELQGQIYHNVSMCTLFRVSLAAEIYRFFNARRVLDPFSGWGDRALGAAGAKVEKYIGVDPNPALVPGYAKLLEFLSKHGITTHRFRELPFEEYDLHQDDFGDNPPDLVFSSPPFHTYELYIDHPSQCTRFADLQEWLTLWLFPVTDRAWEILAPGGNLAYYLADVRGEVTQRLLTHMEKNGRHFRGTIACRRGNKRPVPLWVWQKQAKNEPEDSKVSDDQDHLDSALQEILDSMGDS